MPAIKLAKFSGEQPRLAPRLLPPTAARSANNARLDDGALTPYRASSLVTTIAGDGPFATIYRYDETWLGFTGNVHLAPGPVAADRLYYTGDGVPKLRSGTDIYNLAVPAPTAAPTATASGAGSGDAQTRAYAYTFVTGFGEESEPCPASDDVTWQPGQTVTLSGIEDAPAGRNITKQRFYRTQTGTVGTDFYFIAERDVASTSFVDTVPVDAFAEPLPSRNYNPPPDDLQGLTAMPNGMMAAFVGKQLYFCEPYRPHAWPEIYILTTDVPIVALAAQGTSLLVLTEGVPYRVSGTTPQSMVMDKIRANLPCINARGVVDLGYAVAWPSNDGLAVARLDGSVSLATENLFAPRVWRLLNPGTMRAGQVQGRWIGSYDGVDESGALVSGSLIVDLSGQSFLIRSAVNADAWFYDIGSGLTYYLEDSSNAVRLFDSASAGPETIYWRSKPFIMPRPDTFGCIFVEAGANISSEQLEAREAEIAAAIAANEALIALADGAGGELAGGALGTVTVGGDELTPIPTSLGSVLTVGVFADGERVAAVGTFGRVVRLPSGFSARIWEIDVFSDIAVEQITMARTVDELKVAAGGP